MKFKKSHVVIVSAIILVLMLSFVPMNFTEIKDGVVDWWNNLRGIEPPQQAVVDPDTPVQPIIPVRDAVKVEFTIQDGINSTAITGGNTRVDIIKAVGDVISFGVDGKIEQVTVNSAPEQSTQSYQEGDLLIFHASSDADPTGGEDLYDKWFYCRLVDGEQVREFRPYLVAPVQTSPYKYKFVNEQGGVPTGHRVAYSGGDTPYWSVGIFRLPPRTSDANLDSYLMYGGTTLTAVTTGSDWNFDQANQTADATLTSDDDELTLKILAGANNVGFGSPLITVTQGGKLEERVAVCVITTNATSIGVSALQEEGWTLMQDSTLTSEKGFFITIPEMIPEYGDKFALDITIPIDASGLAGSTAFSMNVWILDCQLLSNVAMGTTSGSVPTAYGCVGEFGIDAINHPRAYTTSSGAGSGMIHYADWTTIA
jgi:hypothetical protein